MTQTHQKKAIRVANRTVGLPMSVHRKIQALLNKGRKIDAVALIREHARVGVRDAKQALENPANFTQSDDEQSTLEIWRNRAIESAAFAKQWIIEHPRNATGGTVMLLLVFGLFISPSTSEASMNRLDPKTWYYDLNSNELFASAAGQGRIEAPSDEPGRRSGVRAFVFTCGSCADEDDRYIGYLEDFTDQAQHAAAQLDAGGDSLDEYALWTTLSQGRKVGAVGTNKWLAYDSPEGKALRTEAINHCGPHGAKPCHP